MLLAAVSEAIVDDREGEALIRGRIQADGVIPGEGALGIPQRVVVGILGGRDAFPGGDVVSGVLSVVLRPSNVISARRFPTA
jgi:hypothetical protein